MNYLSTTPRKPFLTGEQAWQARKDSNRASGDDAFKCLHPFAVDVRYSKEQPKTELGKFWNLLHHSGSNIREHSETCEVTLKYLLLGSCKIFKINVSPSSALLVINRSEGWELLLEEQFIKLDRFSASLSRDTNKTSGLNDDLNKCLFKQAYETCREPYEMGPSSWHAHDFPFSLRPSYERLFNIFFSVCLVIERVKRKLLNAWEWRNRIFFGNHCISFNKVCRNLKQNVEI